MNERGFQCDLCGLLFKHRESHLQHLRTQHLRKEPQQNPNIQAAEANEYFARLSERNALLDELAPDSEQVQRLDGRLARLRTEKAASLLRFID